MSNYKLLRYDKFNTITLNQFHHYQTSKIDTKYGD